MWKLALASLVLVLFSCGKDDAPAQSGSTIDQFRQHYIGQVNTYGIAKKGDSVTLFEEARIITNDNCQYDYAYGSRKVLNDNPKLLEIYSRNHWNLSRGPSSCLPNMLEEMVYRIPVAKLKEKLLNNVTNQCGYLKQIMGDLAQVGFCQQSFLGNSVFRSESSALFKTTLAITIAGRTHQIVHDSTYLYNSFFWAPYPVASRTLIDGIESSSSFLKKIIDYHRSRVDDRDYDHLPRIDYYEGWEL